MSVLPFRYVITYHIVHGEQVVLAALMVDLGHPPLRHAGLVPASTVPHIHRPLGKLRGGCRYKAGMTVEADRVTAPPSYAMAFLFAERDI
jgi:hypothetical protein